MWPFRPREDANEPVPAPPGTHWHASRDSFIYEMRLTLVDGSASWSLGCDEGEIRSTSRALIRTRERALRRDAAVRKVNAR